MLWEIVALHVNPPRNRRFATTRDWANPLRLAGGQPVEGPCPSPTLLKPLHTLWTWSFQSVQGPVLLSGSLTTTPIPRCGEQQESTIWTSPKLWMEDEYKAIVPIFSLCSSCRGPKYSSGLCGDLPRPMAPGYSGNLWLI